MFHLTVGPLQIHFRGYPSADLLPWIGPESLRAAYVNSLKVLPSYLLLSLGQLCLCFSSYLGVHMGISARDTAEKLSGTQMHFLSQQKMARIASLYLLT